MRDKENKRTPKNQPQNSHRKTGNEGLSMKTGQLLTDAMKQVRKVKVAALLNNLNHETAGLTKYFSLENQDH